MMRIRYHICILAAVALLAGGCGAISLSAESTCEDFMAASREAQRDVIEQLYEERHPERPSSSMALGNALMNTEYVCRQSPARELSDVDF